MLFEDWWVQLGKWEWGKLQLSTSRKDSPCWESISKDAVFQLVEGRVVDPGGPLGFHLQVNLGRQVNIELFWGVLCARCKLLVQMTGYFSVSERVINPSDVCICLFAFSSLGDTYLICFFPVKFLLPFSAASSG